MMAIKPAMMIIKKINPIFRPNFLVPKNKAIKNLNTVFDMAAKVMAVAAVSVEMVWGARSAMLMVIASTSATPEIILAIYTPLLPK